MNYKNYVNEFNKLAKEGFAKVKKAEEELEKLKKEKEYGKYNDIYNKQRLNIDIAEKEEELKDIEKSIRSNIRQFEELKDAANKYIDEKYIANPENIDMKVIELLKSGILKANEYSNLLKKSSDNLTMNRIIGKYAKQFYDSNEKSFDHDTKNELIYRINQAEINNGDNYHQKINGLYDTYKRVTNNFAMIRHWDELMNNFIEE